MKFHETHYDEYYKALQMYNFQGAWTNRTSSVDGEDAAPPLFSYPPFENYILYGPSGVGKYSQMINILRHHSPSHLKYENKLISHIEKQSYYINISDIHYEIDMSLLGCYSKIKWNDLFNQIVEIVFTKQGEKRGFIVCKNFHEIHNELLDIFYNYMNTTFSFTHKQIEIKFIILTEHLSFIPTNILNICKIIPVHIYPFDQPVSVSSIENEEEPMTIPEKLSKGIGVNPTNTMWNDSFTLFQNLNIPVAPDDDSTNRSNLSLTSFSTFPLKRKKMKEILECIDKSGKTVNNLKDIYSFSFVKKHEDLPEDNFVAICNAIIKETTDNKSFEKCYFLRDIIYDILIYNVDVFNAICNIFFHFFQNKLISPVYVKELIVNINKFVYQYGNNYRSFFHLEHIFFVLLYYFHRTNEDKNQDMNNEHPSSEENKEEDLSRCISSAMSVGSIPAATAAIKQTAKRQNKKAVRINKTNKNSATGK